MSDEAGRLVFSRDPSGTFIDGMVFGTSGGGENANLEVLCALPTSLYGHMLVPLSWVRWSA